MRLYYALLTALALIAFSAGSLFLSYLGKGRSAAVSLPSITRVKEEFLKKPWPKATFEPFRELPRDGFRELLLPSTALPQLHRYPVREIRGLYEYALHCPKEAPTVASEELRKTLIWEEFACRRRVALPDGFFETKPYMHPSGKSFAWLAKRLGRAPAPPLWAYHALERPPSLLSELGRSGLRGLAAQDGVIIAREKVLLLSGPAPDREGDPAYLVFSRGDWDSHLARSELLAVSLDQVENPADCALREGETCWQFNIGGVYRRISLIQLGIALASLALIGGVVVLIARKIRQDRLQEERRRFALQTLTHELRTPVASLNVNLELLKQRAERLPHELQDEIFRAYDDVQRLHRLTEESRMYLATHSGRGLIKLNEEEVRLDELVRNALEPFEGRVSIELIEAEPRAWCDPYWLGMCIKNLVENALVHGAPPALVRVGSSALVVQDAGRGLPKGLDEMGEAFAKGSASRGLGLGLNIVRRAVREMGGELGYEANPTRFTIRLKGKR